MPNAITRSLQLAAVRKDAAALTAVEAGSGQRVYAFKARDNVPTDDEDTKPDAGERPPANESKPKPGEPSSDDAPEEDDEGKDNPKSFDADEAAKQFVKAFKQHIRGV